MSGLQQAIIERMKKREHQFEVLHRMAEYFDLTKFSEQVEGAPKNEEWDNGYRAAMAIARQCLEESEQK